MTAVNGTVGIGLIKRQKIRYLTVSKEFNQCVQKSAKVPVRNTQPIKNQKFKKRPCQIWQSVTRSATNLQINKPFQNQ